MRVLGIRFCQVSGNAVETAQMLSALGLTARDDEAMQGEGSGAIFPAGTDSWIELWPESDAMPAGIMLQIVVDDAEGFAAHARSNGLDPQGPVEAHGERIYFLTAPSGLAVSFQSQI